MRHSPNPNRLIRGSIPVPERCLRTIQTVTKDASKSPVTVHQLENVNKTALERFATADGQPVTRLARGLYRIDATGKHLEAISPDAP
jgi:hypothetical protein